MSDATTTFPDFRTGAEEAEAASAAAGGSYARIVYLSSCFEKPGDSIVVRFVTDKDEWITVDQYSFLPTKAQPEGYEGKWPSRMGAVSRQDKALRGRYDDDYIAEHMRDGKGKPYKPQPRTWSIACLREEVIGDGSEELGGPSQKGKVLGYKDATRLVKRTVDGEEKEVEEKAFIVCNQAYSNFYSPLDGFARVYGTICDRDYVIRKKGQDLKVDYQSAPLDPVDVVIDGEKVRFTPKDPRFADRYVHDIDIKAILLENASDEYYAKFFDTRVNWTPPSKDDDSTTTGDQAKPDTEASDDRLKRMAERVKANSSGDAPAEEAAPEEVQPAEEAKPAEAAPSGPRDFG